MKAVAIFAIMAMPALVSCATTTSTKAFVSNSPGGYNDSPEVVSFVYKTEPIPNVVRGSYRGTLSNADAIELMSFSRGQTPAASELSISEARSSALREINAIRKAEGFGALTLNAELSAIAQRHAEDMAKRRFLSHNTPDGTTFADRMKATRKPYLYAAENLARGPRNASLLIDAWTRSPRHRKNMMSYRTAKIGLGYADDNHWVAIFTSY